jgi:hypothetical protein
VAFLQVSAVVGVLEKGRNMLQKDHDVICFFNTNNKNIRQYSNTQILQ